MKRKSEQRKKTPVVSKKNKNEPEATWLPHNLPAEIFLLILSKLDDHTLCVAFLINQEWRQWADEVYKNRLQSLEPIDNLVSSEGFFGFRVAYFALVKLSNKKIIDLVFNTSLHVVKREGLKREFFLTQFNDGEQLRVDIPIFSEGDTAQKQPSTNTGTVFNTYSISQSSDTQLMVKHDLNLSSLVYTYQSLAPLLKGLTPSYVLECVLKRINTPLAINEATGQGLLHYFIGTLDYSIIKRLLELGLSPNAENIYGDTPISILFDVCTVQANPQVDWPPIELLQLLLEHQASFFNMPFSIKAIQATGPDPLSKSCLRCMAFLHIKEVFDFTEEQFIRQLSDPNRVKYKLVRGQLAQEIEEKNKISPSFC